MYHNTISASDSESSNTNSNELHEASSSSNNSYNDTELNDTDETANTTDEFYVIRRMTLLSNILSKNFRRHNTRV